MITRSNVIVTLLLVYFFSFVQAQVDTPMEFKSPKINTRKIKQPLQLVSLLIKDKVTEKEKFDAIFLWVADNIQYDYAAYFSSSGNKQLSIIDILNHRKAMCLDYATLMDTLCGYAGLKNITVLGYAKDQLFDVNDTLYIDNHAWNAVKLENEWYLYDVTWSTGENVFKYSPFSAFVLKQLKKIKPKYKAIKIQKDRKLIYKDDCELNSQPVFYYKQKYLNYLIIKILNQFKIKFKRTYTKKINTKYYLSDPETFVITHYPNDPTWSLLSNSSLRKFERDSNYYHLNNQILIEQKHIGKVCLACDSSLLKDEYSKLVNLKQKSLNSNHRNRFITAFCENSMGLILLEESELQPDTLLKIKLLDSTISLFNATQKSLITCKGIVKQEFVSQKNKNQLKQKMLLEDNEKHRKFILQKVRVTLSESRSNRALFNKFNALSKKQRQVKLQLTNIRLNPTSLLKKRKKSNQRILKLKQEISMLRNSHDSILSQLQINQTKFDSLHQFLSLTIWQKAMKHDELFLSFNKSMEYRKMLKDNFKKEVVEARQLIYNDENDYEMELNKLIYIPSKNSTYLGSDIAKSINSLNFISRVYIKKFTELVRNNEADTALLTNLKKNCIEETKRNYCWLESKTLSILSTYMAFDYLTNCQRNVRGIIDHENGIERYRTEMIYQELGRRKRIYNSIVNHNSRIIKSKLIDLRRKKSRMIKSIS